MAHCQIPLHSPAGTLSLANPTVHQGTAPLKGGPGGVMSWFIPHLSMSFQSFSLIPNISAHLWTLWTDLWPPWAIGPILILRLLYVLLSLSLLDALDFPCLYFNPWPLILTSAKIGLIHSHQVSHDLKEIAIGSSKKELEVFSSPQKVSNRCRLQSCGSNFLFFLCVMRGYVSFFLPPQKSKCTKCFFCDLDTEKFLGPTNFCTEYYLWLYQLWTRPVGSSRLRLVSHGLLQQTRQSENNA